MGVRLPDETIPDIEELSTLFSEAAGQSESLTARDRRLLVLWERTVREHILSRHVSPTTEPHRWPLQDERASITHKFCIPSDDSEVEDFEGYLTAGCYDDGKLGEIFLTMAKEGSFVSGIMDSFVTAISIGLQHGISLEAFARKFKHTAFEPAGLVQGAPQELRGFTKSVLDYLFRWLELRFPGGRLRESQPKTPIQDHNHDETIKPLLAQAK